MTAARHHLRLSVLAAGLIAGCDGGASCDGALKWSITASVSDAATGKPICDASGVARDGDFQQDLKCWGAPQCGCSGVSERFGTYEVTISAPGYQPLTKTVVVSESDECHIQTEHADFKLTPL